jgi:hypothetical protein
MELWWPIVPGLALFVAGILIQFGSYFRRPIPVRLLLAAVRLRFIGIGVLFLGIGVDSAISALFGGLEIARLALGLVMFVFAGLRFYAASDRIFRRP